MNHPGATQQADMKLEQLSRAKKLGFQIPDTLVTNNSELVMDFYDKHDGEIIYKVMSSGILAHNKVEKSVFDIPHAVYTTPISDKELAMISSVEHVPCLFQEYVPKKREYRVTIVESDVFVVAIDTQEDEKARIDWRHNNLSSQYSLGSLPIEISSKCIELTKNYGLNFSAIDLIETPQGEFIFLEINPNGQFMFLEKFLPELRITEAVANCLIRG